ncbi:hypothetical protein NPIL_695001 [Nephila pilipes]|uniref:Uncharacterized protein n=1 Tax=Nephila pilipes TaxID=299642 RepID=A0A8X6QFH4_NEPPI|nr:hypothetical protein NPIL_695001 [Nephila pilipes]
MSMAFLFEVRRQHIWLLNAFKRIYFFLPRKVFPGNFARKEKNKPTVFENATFVPSTPAASHRTLKSDYENQAGVLFFVREVFEATNRFIHISFGSKGKRVIGERGRQLQKRDIPFNMFREL